MVKKWDPDSELNKLRYAQKLRQHRRWFRSCLDPYTRELTDLRLRGASLSLLRDFLKSRKLIVDRSTIQRWCVKHSLWPVTNSKSSTN